MENRSTPWWRSRSKLPFAVFLAIGGFFLWAEHQAHVIEFLPWILVLVCVGMHFFMHGGHGHGGGHDHGGNKQPTSDGADDGAPPR